MKVLMFSDLHSHKHKQSIERLNDCLLALRWACTSAIERGITDVLFLGDLFQDRSRMDVFSYQRTFEVFEEFSGLNFRLLLGNHDLWFADKWDVSSVTPLKALPHVTVIDRPTSTDIGGRTFDWLPFVKNPLKAVDQYFPKREDRVLCAHVAIDGCQLNSAGHVSDVSVEHESDMVKVDRSRFGAWDRVFLGHYHAPQHLTDTMEYVGSPLQLNFAEAGQVKHLVVLDTDTLAVEYVENTFSPKHVIVSEDGLAEVDLVNNYVWIRDDMSKFDKVEAHRKAAGGQARELKFREDRTKVVRTDGDMARFDQANGDYRQRYVKAVGTGGLNEAELILWGARICEGE